MAEPSFVRAYPPALPAQGQADWFLFQEGDLITLPSEERIEVPSQSDIEQMLPESQGIYFGLLDGIPCLTADIPGGVPIPGTWQRSSLRTLFGRLDETRSMVAGYAAQLLYWLQTSRYCPVCGNPTIQGERDWGRKCPACGHVGYPRISPAVLILIKDEDKILLAQKPGWGKRFSILAGFVEPGETLEDCVKRETLEEVGLQVRNLTYAGSQTWPFPHQLMVGFEAELDGGAITLDQLELQSAAWFTRENLPELPPNVSLSRQMIDGWTHRKPG